MIKIPKNFDGNKFAAKYGLSSWGRDFWADRENLYCPSLPDLTEADISDCVVDVEMQTRIQSRKGTAKAQAKNIPSWAAWDETQAVSYITNNATDLASAKTVLIAMARMLVALRDETWPDLPE